MIKRILLGSIALLMSVSAYASKVYVWNFVENNDQDIVSAHALFDSRGSLLSGTLQNNIRLGAFSDGFDAEEAWAVGDLIGLNSHFDQFGATLSMLDLEAGGIFDTDFTSTDDSFADRQIILWVSSHDDFLDPTSQQLIFRFNVSYQDPSGISSQWLSLNQESGSLLVGEYGNYSHSYDFASEVLPGYNLVGVIPEPSTYALFAGAMILGLTLWSRRHRIGAS